MKRFEVTVAVTERYRVTIDSYDEEEACDDVYDMPVHEIMEGDFLYTEVEIDNIEEVTFDKED
jgi:hypothetical protein